MVVMAGEALGSSEAIIIDNFQKIENNVLSKKKKTDEETIKKKKKNISGSSRLNE